jgi:hypothetical protein
MTKKSKKMVYPIDDRPVIFNLINLDDIDYIGRYIENKGVFMLSLNDEKSNFVHESEINEWWYVDEHPAIMREVLNTKTKKKNKVKKSKRKDDDAENTNDYMPPFMQMPPPFVLDFFNQIQNMGVDFKVVNVRNVGEKDLSTLPNKVLEQILKKAEEEENYALAIKVRDAIKSKSNEE